MGYLSGRSGVSGAGSAAYRRAVKWKRVVGWLAAAALLGQALVCVRLGCEAGDEAPAPQQRRPELPAWAERDNPFTAMHGVRTVSVENNPPTRPAWCFAVTCPKYAAAGDPLRCWRTEPECREGRDARRFVVISCDRPGAARLGNCAPTPSMWCFPVRGDSWECFATERGCEAKRSVTSPRMQVGPCERRWSRDLEGWAPALAR